jgi:hypothetical protein
MHTFELFSESMLIIPIPPSSTHKQHTSLFPPLTMPFPFNPFPTTLDLPLFPPSTFPLFHTNPSSFSPPWEKEEGLRVVGKGGRAKCGKGGRLRVGKGEGLRVVGKGEGKGEKRGRA